MFASAGDTFEHLLRMPQVIDAVSVVASLLCIWSYFARTHRSLTLTAMTGVLAWALYFGLKGAWTPCVLSFVMALRVAAGVWVVGWEEAQRWKATFLGWSVAGLGAYLTWQGRASMPSLAATLFLTWAGLHLPLKPLRWALLIGEALWFVNGLVLGSTLACLSAAAAMLINTAIIFKSRSAEAVPN